MQPRVVPPAAADGAAEVISLEKDPNMWYCDKCGEQHEDQFQVCWKCASDELAGHVTAEPPEPKAEPKLRSGGSILIRMLIGFVVGAILGGAGYTTFGPRILHGDDPGAAGAGSFAVIAGVGLALAVGMFFWVLFPFEPTPAPPAPPETPIKHDDLHAM